MKSPEVTRFGAPARVPTVARTIVRALAYRTGLLVCIAVVLLYVAPHAGATPTNCNALEDQPGWSWSECGNLERGVILKGNRYALVDAALYCHARRAGMIDRKRTEHVKGDGIARDRGCSARYFAQPTDIEHALAALKAGSCPANRYGYSVDWCVPTL